MTCPDETKWTEFVVSPSEPALEQHLATCAACQATVAHLTRLTQRLASDDVGLESALSVDAVVATALRPRRPVRALVAVAASLTVLAAGGLALQGRQLESETMTARGEAPAWRARVTTRLVSTSAGLIEPGTVVPVTTRFTVASFGVLATDRLFTLAFVADSKGVVHWVAPTWLDERSVPTAAALGADGGFRTNPEHVLSLDHSVAFDDLAPGPASLVTMVLEAPVSVLAVERAWQGEAAGLRARFGEALVRVVPVELR